MIISFAINYGGRDELVRAYKKMMKAGVKANEITEELVNDYLDTAEIPEVDLVIRTGGDQRLSGYLPWQTTYAELYFCKEKWPAFSDIQLDEAIAWFQEQKRNRGK